MSGFISKSNTIKYKTIGVLGGMGPEATAEFYLRIIRIFQQDFRTLYDSDFPEIIILSLPIPDIVETPTAENIVKKMLVDGAKKLEIAGADLIAMPCNTTTYYLPEIKKAVSIPIINIVEETANEINKLGLGRVGLLGTEMTIRKNIYGKVLNGVNLLTLNEFEQKKTTRVILNILAGKQNDKDKKTLNEFIRKLKRKGAEKIILGCSELPLIIKDNKDCLDTLRNLVKATVKKSTETEGFD